MLFFGVSNSNIILLDVTVNRFIIRKFFELSLVVFGIIFFVVVSSTSYNGSRLFEFQLCVGWCSVNFSSISVETLLVNNVFFHRIPWTCSSFFFSLTVIDETNLILFGWLVKWWKDQLLFLLTLSCNILIQGVFGGWIFLRHIYKSIELLI